MTQRRPPPGHPLHHLPSGAGAIVDVGCNTGDALLFASELGPRRWLGGIDINPAAVASARRRLAHLPMAEVHHGSADRLPFGSGSASVVLCSEVLEHVPSGLRPLAVAEMHRVLDDRGILILTVPFRGAFAALDPANVRMASPRVFGAVSRLMRRPGREAGYRGQKHGVVWHHHFSMRELRGLLEPAFALEIVRGRGCLLAPMCSWLAFPFYRLGAADHPAMRAIGRLERWELSHDFGPRLAYDLLVVARKAS